MRELDLDSADGRVLHAYDLGATGRADELVVMWHHGTPNIGAPPEPLFETSRALGIRWIGYDRPGYGGSTPDPAATVSAAAADAGRVADHLGIHRFAVLGHSGGGPRALACGALLADRVLAVVSVSAPAPWPADGLDYFAGMSSGGTRELRAAIKGRAELADVLASNEFDAAAFTAADYAALSGAWSWFDGIVAAATAGGSEGMITDDVAAMAPWGFEPTMVRPPTLIMHGTDDRMVPSTHSAWLAAHCPAAELRLVPDAGHISVLDHAEVALRWLRAHALAG